MTLASANRVQTTFIEETTFGVTPVTGNAVNLRYTGGSLDFNLTKVTSKEIRADRMESDVITVDAKAAGDKKIELSYKEFDPFIEAVLGGTWAGGSVSNGTINRTFSVQDAFLDIDQYLVYRGMGVDKLTLEFESGKLVDGSIVFMGKDAVLDDTTQMPGTVVESQTYDVMNAVTGVGELTEGGVLMADTFIKKMTLSIDGKLRELKAIGTLGAAQINQGTFSITGTVDMYFADAVMYNKFRNSTASSLSWVVSDGAGNGYRFTLPKLKYSDTKVTTSAKDTDVMLNAKYTALYDPTTGVEITIEAIDA